VVGEEAVALGVASAEADSEVSAEEAPEEEAPAGAGRDRLTG